MIDRSAPGHHHLRLGATATTRRKAAAAAEGGPVTPEQCIKARRLLGLTQRRLARMLRLQQAHVSFFERTGDMPRPQLRGRSSRMADLKAALEAAGVVFTNGTEPGVKLRKGDQ